MINPYDPDKFRKFKAELCKVLKEKGLDRAISYSVASNIPLIAAYTFILEEFPEYDTLCQDKIKQLKEFYGVE